MTTLRELITSPTWWITGVVLAVALNWVSTFLYNRMAILFPKLYSKFVFRTKEKQAKREEIIKSIQEDELVRRTYRHLETRRRLQGIVYLLLGGITFLMYANNMNMAVALKSMTPFDRMVGRYAVPVLAGCMFMLSYVATYSAWRINQLLNEADGTVQYYP